MTVGDHQGHGRVLWTNYEYALVYECFDPQEDGGCGSDVNIVVYGRTRTLPADVIDELVPLSESGCFKRDNFERVPQEGKNI